MNCLPNYINFETWEAFVEMRKANKKAPFTDFAKKLILKELAKFHAEGYDANSSLEQAIMNGWRGVFRAELRQGMQAVRIAKPVETFKERDARLGREKWELMTGRQHPENMRPNVLDVFTMDLLEFANDQSH